MRMIGDAREGCGYGVHRLLHVLHVCDAQNLIPLHPSLHPISASPSLISLSTIPHAYTRPPVTGAMFRPAVNQHQQRGASHAATDTTSYAAPYASISAPHSSTDQFRITMTPHSYTPAPHTQHTEAAPTSTTATSTHQHPSLHQSTPHLYAEPGTRAEGEMASQVQAVHPSTAVSSLPSTDAILLMSQQLAALQQQCEHMQQLLYTCVQQPQPAATQ